MKIIECTRCGSPELTEHDGFVHCDYCKSRFVLQAGDVAVKQTTIGIQSDVDALLQKCQDDPLNSRRYVDLILDIDPTNQKVNQYMQKKGKR